MAIIKFSDWKREFSVVARTSRAYAEE